MRRVTCEMRDGKARYDGLALSEWLPKIVQRPVEQFAPYRIVLFGSIACGDDGSDSDVDLLVILPELRLCHHDAVVSMLRSLRDLPVPIDLVVTDIAELEVRAATPGVVRVALREGAVVHG